MCTSNIRLEQNTFHEVNTAHSPRRDTKDGMTLLSTHPCTHTCHQPCNRHDHCRDFAIHPNTRLRMTFRKSLCYTHTLRHRCKSRWLHKPPLQCVDIVDHRTAPSTAHHNCKTQRPCTRHVLDTLWSQENQFDQDTQCCSLLCATMFCMNTKHRLDKFRAQNTDSKHLPHTQDHTPGPDTLCCTRSMQNRHPWEYIPPCHCT
mmetsp:Transcript_30877/g.49826  ORF Transcript_30877/g.49826 Transcript_30877/m.49826 type:complete len:202 (+) Transcript_30877:764-1369(+)